MICGKIQKCVQTQGFEVKLVNISPNSPTFRANLWQTIRLQSTEHIKIGITPS